MTNQLTNTDKLIVSNFKILINFGFYYYVFAVTYLWRNNSLLPRKRLVVGERRIIHYGLEISADQCDPVTASTIPQ